MTTSEDTVSRSPAACIRTLLSRRHRAAGRLRFLLTKPLDGDAPSRCPSRGGTRKDSTAATRSMTPLTRERPTVLRPSTARHHRRDGPRPARPRARDGRAERRPGRAETMPACRSPRCARRCSGGVRTSGDSRNRDFAGPHVEAEASRRICWRSPTTRRRRRPADRAAREKDAVLAATFTAHGLFLERIGGVVEARRFACVSSAQSRPCGREARGRIRALALRGCCSPARRSGSGLGPGLRRRGLAARRAPSSPRWEARSTIEFGNRVFALFPIVLSLLTSSRSAGRQARPLGACRTRRSSSSARSRRLRSGS